MDLMRIASQGSPLEVLSNTAAAILQINSEGIDRASKESSKETLTSKELPTKECKMKRSKDRRELAHSSSFRLRRSISPHLIDERSNPESFEAFQGLSSPLNANYMKPLDSQSSYLLVNDCRRERSSSSCSFNYRGSPFEINGPNGEIQLIRRNSDPHSSRYLAVPSEYCDDDQPLDMSKKSRTSSDSESQSLPRSEVSTPDTANNLQQQMRPSVITCAPSLRPKLTLSPNCQSCNLSHDLEKCSTSSNTKLNGHNCNSEAGHRKQILSGVCDPVIDEHFRRSLGKEYSELFINNNNNANNSPSVSMSVDDHFAKALGETWQKLQQKDKEVTIERDEVNKTQRISTKTSL